METAYVDVGNNKWGVLFLYNFDMRNWDEMAAIMVSFGMSDSGVKEAIRALSSYNSGMAISNDKLRMSVVFIGKSTSESQFLNTLVHEIKHVTDAIIDYYGEEQTGESAAHLDGHLMQMFFEEAAKSH